MARSKYEDEYDEYYSKDNRNQDILSGAGTGAGSGAAIGTAIAPGIGTAIGAGAGALIGAGAGALQARGTAESIKEAEERDRELQERLDQVDHLAKFSEIIGLQTSEAAAQSKAEAQQAAARGGLSGAQQAGLLTSAGAARGKAQTAALAGAVAPSTAADRAERGRIMEEEIGRQNLANDAVSGAPDYISAVGQLGALGTQLAGTQAGNQARGNELGGFSGQGRMAREAGSSDVTVDNIDALSSSPDFSPVSGFFGGGGGSEISRYERNGDPGINLPRSEADFLAEEYGPESQKLQALMDTGAQAEMKAVTQEQAVLDIQGGVVTEDMLMKMKESYPFMFDNPEEYQKAKQAAGVGGQDYVDPILVKQLTGTYYE